MIKKRYVISELDPISVLDMDTGDTFPIADGSGFVEAIVECLNVLHEENQALKKKLEFFYELNKPYGPIIEENKRLKSFISRLTNDCGEIVLMNGMGYNVKKIFGDLE